jgi:hypothetical protein
VVQIATSQWNRIRTKSFVRNYVIKKTKIVLFLWIFVINTEMLIFFIAVRNKETFVFMPAESVACCLFFNESTISQIVSRCR